MTDKPDAAWVEAANVAANRVYEAIGSMDDVKLDLALTAQETAKGSNSADSSFLDYLESGGHLNENFLAGAR